MKPLPATLSMACGKQLAPLLLCLLAALMSPAQADDEKARQLINRYTATWDVNEFLAEADIVAGLEALPAEVRETLLINLSVTGGIEYYGGALLVRGNAPHLGGEEEAALCVQPWSETPLIYAGIHSQQQITIYARDVSYNGLPTCIKDWITQINSRHADRLGQPQNVQVIAAG